jgi:hypothetical protein
MNRSPCAILTGVVLLGGSGFAQVSLVTPKHFSSATPISLETVSRVEVSHNSPAAIRQELQDTNTLGLIAASTHLSAKDLATLAVAPDPANLDLWFYSLEGGTNAWDAFGSKLEHYVHGRLGGHTRAFLLSDLTNATRSAEISDPDLRALLSQRPELPAVRLRRWDLGANTNQSGELFRTAEYYYVDGEVAWTYQVGFSEGGKVLGVSEWRVDAKEYDPEYRKVIQEVDQAVLAEVKQEATQALSQSKREKLRAKGLSYRTFEELNPGVIADWFK